MLRLDNIHHATTQYTSKMTHQTVFHRLRKSLNIEAAGVGGGSSSIVSCDVLEDIEPNAAASLRMIKVAADETDAGLAWLALLDEAVRARSRGEESEDRMVASEASEARRGRARSVSPSSIGIESHGRTTIVGCSRQR